MYLWGRVLGEGSVVWLCIETVTHAGFHTTYTGQEAKLFLTALHVTRLKTEKFNLFEEPKEWMLDAHHPRYSPERSFL